MGVVVGREEEASDKGGRVVAAFEIVGYYSKWPDWGCFNQASQRGRDRATSASQTARAALRSGIGQRSNGGARLLAVLLLLVVWKTSAAIGGVTYGDSRKRPGNHRNPAVCRLHHVVRLRERPRRTRSAFRTHVAVLWHT